MKEANSCHKLKSTRGGSAMFLMCFLAYASTYVGRLNYSAAMAQMLLSNVITKTQGGTISTVYFFCYGGGQLINGFIADKASPYKQITIGILGAALANLGMYFAPGYVLMALLWGLNGYFQSLVWAPILRIVAQVIPDSLQKKSLMGLASTTAIGSLSAYLLSSAVMTVLSWQYVFMASAAVMLISCGIWVVKTRLILREDEGITAADIPAPAMPQEAAPREPVEPKGAPQIAAHSLWWLLAASGLAVVIIPLMINGMLKDGMTAWIPTFLTEIFHAPAQLAVLASTLLPVINLTGAYAAYYINDHFFHNEVATSSFFFALSGVCVTLLYFFSGVNMIFTMLLFAIVTSSMLAINTMLVSLVPVRFGRYGKTATMSGIFNSMAYIGCAISNYLIGYISELFGWNTTIIVWAVCCALAVAGCALAAGRWKKFALSDESVSA